MMNFVKIINYYYLVYYLYYNVKIFDKNIFKGKVRWVCGENYFLMIWNLIISVELLIYIYLGMVV